MAPAANLFEVEQAIIGALSPLQVSVPDLRVGSAIGLVGTRDPAQHCPGIYVAPGAPSGTQNSGAGVLERQTWDVVCAVRAITRRADSAPLTHEALGELAAAALLAVQGVEGLEYTGRRDVFYDVGYAELSLTFACDRQFDPTVELADLSDFNRFYADWDMAAPDGQIDATDDVRAPGASAPAVHRAAHEAARDPNWPRLDDSAGEP